MNSLGSVSKEDEDFILNTSVHYVHKLKQQESSSTGKPVGYIRAKVYNKSILVKALVDSGNLFADLISEDLARKLKLKVTGTERKVGTASTQGSVTIIGRAKPFKLYLEGISHPVQIQPYVVKELAHPLNLGQAFLRSNDVDMTFRSGGVLLKLRGSCSKLQPSNASLNRPTIDTRIQQVLDRLKEQGGNPYGHCTDVLDLRVNQVKPGSEARMPGVHYSSNKRPIEWSDTRHKVFAASDVLLKAGCMTVVPVSKSRHNKTKTSNRMHVNEVYVSPKSNIPFLNKNNLWRNPGCYRRTGDETKVMVTNFGTTDVVLPKYCTIGYLAEATRYAGPSINLLDHKPTEQLSEAEVVERRAYIIKGLRMDDNPLMNEDPSIKEAVVQIFMDHWDAVSVNDSDFGKTNLMKFHIDIPKDAAPVRAKVRPLNPMQEQDLKRQLED